MCLCLQIHMWRSILCKTARGWRKRRRQSRRTPSTLTTTSHLALKSHLNKSRYSLSHLQKLRVYKISILITLTFLKGNVLSCRDTFYCKNQQVFAAYKPLISGAHLPNNQFRGFSSKQYNQRHFSLNWPWFCNSTSQLLGWCYSLHLLLDIACISVLFVACLTKITMHNMI